MHSIPKARQILVAITAGAVLAGALPAVADAAPFPPGPTKAPADGPIRVVEGGQRVPVEEAPSRLPVREEPVLTPRPSGGMRIPVEAELRRLRASLGGGAVVIGRGASLADRLESIRIAIAEHNADDPPSLRVAVTMGPADLRVTEAGAARMRLFCKSGVADACRGVAWLSTEDGDLVAQTTFRVKAGTAKRPQLAIPARFRRDGLKLVASAAMRDASGTVWTAARQMTLAA